MRAVTLAALVGSGAVSGMFFSTSGPNTGNAVANVLINRLVRNANVTIIERAALDKLIAEQNLTNSDRTDPLTAAKLGHHPRRHHAKRFRG
jgi:hypothetical protein